MSNNEFGLVTVQLFLLIALAHLCGYLFTRMRQRGVLTPRWSGCRAHFVSGRLVAGARYAPREPLSTEQPVEVIADPTPVRDELAA
jgi:hypothetical protein